MPTPRLSALLVASGALFLVPTALAEAPKTEQVTIEFEFEATPEATYENIRAQAWQVCKQDVGSTYASARNRLRRACQKQVVADVMKQLSQSGEVQLAATEAADTQ